MRGFRDRTGHYLSPGLGNGRGGGGGAAEDFGLNKVKFSTTAAEIPRKNKSRSRSLLEVRRIFFFNTAQFDSVRNWEDRSCLK